MKTVIQTTTTIPDGLTITTEVDANTGEYLGAREEWDAELTEGQVDYRKGKWGAVLQAEKAAAVLSRQVTPMAAVLLVMDLLDTMIADQLTAAIFSKEAADKFKRLKELLTASSAEVSSKEATR